jgi:hypothetical protein
MKYVLSPLNMFNGDGLYAKMLIFDCRAKQYMIGDNLTVAFEFPVYSF